MNFAFFVKWGLVNCKSGLPPPCCLKKLANAVNTSTYINFIFCVHLISLSFYLLHANFAACFWSSCVLLDGGSVSTDTSIQHRVYFNSVEILGHIQKNEASSLCNIYVKHKLP